jgi:DNA-binding HxlR family transcriptional regulator
VRFLSQLICYRRVVTSQSRWYTNETCSVARTLEVIGERWTILVLREAFMRVRRFDDFQRNIGVARNILSARLRKLVEAGVLERRQYSDRPPRFEYRLTECGLDLYPAIVALMEWGDRYVANPGGPPVLLHHRSCGRESTLLMVCSECREPIRARDMQPRPGPGALPDVEGV